MTLIQLVANLRSYSQAHGNSIALDEQVFPDAALRADIAVAFELDENASLTINGMPPGKIPDPADDAVTIPVGTAKLLNQLDFNMHLVFTAPDGTVQANICATPVAPWTFQKSYASLSGLFPLDALGPKNTQFIYATEAVASYAWPGEPATTIELSKGLNLLCDAGFGDFSVLGAILKGQLRVTPFSRSTYC